ncbi:MAG: putative multi-sensor signal transduction histidine kinase [Actinomycetia bacterium]|nr:putative multi-sensor signal transduction histidine kinase [Actinomycetes bacterium]
MATVLIVDDRPTNRELMRTLLGYGGHEVIEASEGTEALGLAHSQRPDLVLTDILMPGMDGYQLAQELRAAPDTAQTPIVFYTANYLEDEIRPFADACGVARVLLKSADPSVLMSTIDEVLAEGRAATRPADVGKADREHLHAISAKLFEKAQTLTDTEARFQLMAESSPVGIVFGDQHGSASYVNARLAEIMDTAAGDLLGMGWLRAAGDEHRAGALSAACSRAAHAAQYRSRCQITLPDGSLRWLSLHVRAVPDGDRRAGFVATVDDVTTTVEADQRLVDADRLRDHEAKDRAVERLDSLSRLAGGVAHDFNNILGVILAFESFVSESITGLTTAGGLDAGIGQALLGDLERIRTAGERAAGLTQQLLAFGRRTVIHLVPLDLNQAVRASNDLLSASSGTTINLVTTLAPGLHAVVAEPTKVAQILLNLTQNAAQAMPGGGTITITTSNLDPPGHPGAGPGSYARLTIQDTGYGMTPEILERAVEPFFTTKPGGQGTGFGLATVYGIVNQLGGNFAIESAPGAGTLVTIDLPATADPIEAPPPPAAAAHGGTETILVAEDEDGIRESCCRILAQAGYAVLAAGDGPAAMDLAERHPGHIDLLLTDVMMPGMRGDELARLLGGRRPGTRTLFMSGYAGDLMNPDGILEAGLTVLPKPFTENELLATVRSAIDVTQR